MKTNKHTLGSLLIISFLLVVATFDVKAQSNWEVGLRFGEPTVALDATVPLSAAPRLHLAAHLEDPFVLGAYFDWMFSLSNGPTGLKFYPGVGPEFKFGSDYGSQCQWLCVITALSPTISYLGYDATSFLL